MSFFLYISTESHLCQHFLFTAIGSVSKKTDVLSWNTDSATRASNSVKFTMVANASRSQTHSEHSAVPIQNVLPDLLTMESAEGWYWCYAPDLLRSPENQEHLSLERDGSGPHCNMKRKAFWTERKCASPITMACREIRTY